MQNPALKSPDWNYP